MSILTSIENILPIIFIIALGFYLNEKGGLDQTLVGMFLNL